MYDEVILDRAVQIAAKNGWDGDIERSGYAPLVFNKDFAKALFGSDLRTIGFSRDKSTDPYEPITIPEWQYHLQQMVISPDSIKYLSDHMP